MSSLLKLKRNIKNNLVKSVYNKSTTKNQLKPSSTKEFTIYASSCWHTKYQPHYNFYHISLKCHKQYSYVFCDSVRTGKDKVGVSSIINNNMSQIDVTLSEEKCKL